MLIAGRRTDGARCGSTDLPQDRAGELVFAVGAAGERYALDAEGRVVRTDAGADERALAGSSFARWLDATVAREQVLYGPDGEYAPDVFDPSGEEVTPLVALRQAERALKQDPGAAGAAHARGLALRRLGRLAAAVDALDEATALDPENPWPWFDLGRAALDDGQNARAVKAFARAAELDAGPEGGRLLAWAARAAGTGAEADTRCGAAALARDGAVSSSRSGAPSTRRRRIRIRRRRRRRRRCWRRSRPVRRWSPGGDSRSSQNWLLRHRHQLARVVLAPQHRRDPAGPGGDRERRRRGARPGRRRRRSCVRWRPRRRGAPRPCGSSPRAPVTETATAAVLDLEVDVGAKEVIDEAGGIGADLGEQRPRAVADRRRGRGRTAPAPERAGRRAAGALCAGGPVPCSAVA